MCGKYRVHINYAYERPLDNVLRMYCSDYMYKKRNI